MPYSFNNGPYNLNTVEINMVNWIYARQIGFLAIRDLSSKKMTCSKTRYRKRKKFIKTLIFLVALTGCTKSVVQPVTIPPPVIHTCKNRVQLQIVNALDQSGNPVVTYKDFDPPLCVCEDEVVRQCN